MLVDGNMSVFWMLLRILAVSGLVERIREEIEPHARVLQPGSIRGIYESPKLRLDHNRLAKECPLLKSCYWETLRLHSQPRPHRQAPTDFVVAEENCGGHGGVTDDYAYQVHHGDDVLVSPAIYTRTPRYFDHPDKFLPERFMIEQDDGTLAEAHQGNISLYCGG